MTNTYKVTKDGEEVFTYQCDGGPIEGDYPFDVFTHELLPAPPVCVYGGRRKITRFEFLSLFSMEERVAYRTMMQSDPILQDFNEMLNLADIVDLDYPMVQQGMGYWVNIGIITEDRKNVILRG